MFKYFREGKSIDGHICNFYYIKGVDFKGKFNVCLPLKVSDFSKEIEFPDCSGNIEIIMTNSQFSKFFKNVSGGKTKFPT